MLENEWYELEIAPGVDCSKPGIYRWVIEGAGIFEGAGVRDGRGVYIGRYTNISRPTVHYPRQVDRLLKGRRSHHPDGHYRDVYHALAKGRTTRRRIILTILKNCERADLNRLEQEFRRSEGANLNGQTSGWSRRRCRP